VTKLHHAERDAYDEFDYDGVMPDPLENWLADSLDDLDRRSLRRRLTERHGPQRGCAIEIAGEALVNFGSNDYLGLASEPRVVAAVRSALDEYGWGSGASPLVTGRSDLHLELEKKLAEFEGTEASLLFPTGYAANVGTITALVGKGDVIYSDGLNHASIIDGCRLSGAAVHIYPHRFFYATNRDDLALMRKMVEHARPYRRRLIVTDAIFSMNGACAPLMGLARFANEIDAMLMVDEAHATGVIGDHGGGLCDAVLGGERVNVRIGTLSKALGSHGGFVAGSRRLIDWIANRARPYMFSTAAPAAAAAAAIAALEIVGSEPERRQKLQELSGRLRSRLARNNIKTPSLTHIIPIILNDPNRALAVAAELRRRGFFVPAIRPPSVPEGQSLLRISLTCLHTEEQIDDLVAALGQVVGQ
jgi:8-amino-7-oxononanoate synthase